MFARRKCVFYTNPYRPQYDFKQNWDEIFAANLNMENFLRDLLDASEEPMVWYMDEVDKLFTAPFASDFFGLVRSWHKSRSTEPDGPWRKLTVVIAYATKGGAAVSSPPSALIRDPNSCRPVCGRGRDALPVRREGDRQNSTRMSLERESLSAGRRIPHLHGPVLTGCR
jgi:hypothetical protein